jgi:hypothetical protein
MEDAHDFDRVEGHAMKDNVRAGHNRTNALDNLVAAAARVRPVRSRRTASTIFLSSLSAVDGEVSVARYSQI